jgi:hypothetical protein
VLFDVDFTLAKPGPDLGPEGYRRLGLRYGLELDPARYSDARNAALETLLRHPELRHEEEMWFVLHGANHPCHRLHSVVWEPHRPHSHILRATNLPMGRENRAGRHHMENPHSAVDVDAAAIALSTGLRGQLARSSV